MMASSFEFRAGSLVLILGLVAACGGSSKTADGGSGGTSGSGGKGGTTSTSGSGGTTSTSGSSGKGGTTSTSGSGGTTSTSGSGGTGDPVTIVTGTCPAFTACGGDVVGTWKLGSICEAGGAPASDPAMAGLPSCATDNAVETLSSDAVYDFKADGTFTASGNSTVDYRVSFDDACAMTAFMLDAASTCAVLMASAGQATSAGSFDCALTGGVCACDFSIAAQTDEVGTYTIDGDQMTVSYTQTDDTGAVTSQTDTNPFCVEGNTLTEASTDGSLATLTRK